MVDDPDLYEGREQSRVKHDIVRRYLESFAHVVAFAWPSITFIDGFSGPWNSHSNEFADTSFSIAIHELRRARDTHSSMGRRLKIRCVFVEKNRAAYEKLKEFADSIRDAEIRTIHGEFQNSIGEIVSFVREDTDTFAFTLIDPTGATGFPMQRIAPLLQLRPGEVLVTFMLEFIRRMIQQQGLRRALQELFGSDDFDENLENLTGIDRDDAITEKYCESLGRYCKYPYVLRATILHPDKDRLYFQLIYATRNLEGVRKFKLAEEKAMHTQDALRASVEIKQDLKRSGGQTSFLDAEKMPESAYYLQLRNRYLTQSRRQVTAIINSAKEIFYDDLWLAAVSFPMVWESDLRDWLRLWLANGALEWRGKKPRERTIKQGVGHIIARLAGTIN